MTASEANWAYYEEWNQLICAMLTEDPTASDKWDALSAREAASGDVPLVLLKNRLGLTEFECFVVALALAAEMEPEILRLNGGPPDYRLAVRLYESWRYPLDRYLLRSSLRLHPLLEPGWERGALILTQTASHLLCGFIPSLPGCTHGLPSNLPETLTEDDGIRLELEKCLEYALTGRPTAVILHGLPGSGRCYHTKKLCEARGLPLLEINGETLPTEAKELYRLLDDISLLLKLSFSAVCLRRYHVRLRDYAARLLEATPFLVITVQESETLPVFDCGVLVAYHTLPPLTHRQQRQVWGSLLERYAISPDFDLRRVSNQYRLTIGAIEKTVQMLALRRDAGLSCGETELRTILEENCLSGAGSQLARLIRPKFTWDDLILPMELTERLHEICHRMHYMDQVMDEWGFSKKYPYGTGLSVLFYGAPGTGKTMAAHVLANELQIPLLHVVFSNMIDKYIGETEKHILQLFEQARQMNAILFFDEADALFAKRTDASDATDRYANAQTACLLQCVEEYDGMVILSTNLLSGFDEAYRRRIRCFLHFHHPDEAMRRSIWERAFPQEAALAPDVDFSTLARPELPAGSIKNIVLTAAYLAAGQGEIGMEHLTAAYQMEQRKENHTAGGHMMDEWI